MPQDFQKSIVRIHHKDGGIMGAGFFATARQVITCAHVISSCLGLEVIPQEATGITITLDFPLKVAGQMLTASIKSWNPGLDIAILEITEDLPAQVYFPPLFKSREITGHEFHVYGFPDGVETGRWSFGNILGAIGNNKVQIESKTAYTIRPGFSGSLVWDATDNKIIGIIAETDENVRETKTAYFLPVNSILESFPQLETVQPVDNRGMKYSCFISYPNEIGLQGQLVREFAEAIHNALSVEIGSMLDLPIYFDRDHINENRDLARALCESACFVMVLTPKYFSERMPLCTLEFKAMQELEASRRRTMERPGDLSFIIPIRPFSRDILPMNIIGQCQDYDFHEMIVSGNLRAHPQYGLLVRQLAEHIYKCYQLLESCDQDPCSECFEFRLPAIDQVRDLFQLASLKSFAKFPLR